MTMSESIYGDQTEHLRQVKDLMIARINEYNNDIQDKTGHSVFEHLNSRIKTEASMREKCMRKGVEETPYQALRTMKDAIGIRIITRFIEDIFQIRDFLNNLEDCQIIQEKDYIRQAKSNGYRSYHMILETRQPIVDIEGNNPGLFYLEIQLRTIAMDCWASLEHEMKYKKSITNQKILDQELKRCADELASCDITMQTIRDMIRADEQEPEEKADKTEI